MRLPLALFGLLLSALSATTRAETVKDRQAAVLKDRASLENDPRWIYNDYDRGFAEAKRTGKPLLVVLRCIPCLACAGIDARVLLENTDLTPLLDRFVCVRVINANALDLSRLQFDFDLSFSTLIFNGDGTLYGRYGSWTHQRDPREETTEGFRKALEAALELHKNYPANAASLEGKQPRRTSYKTPIDMPTIQGKYTRNLDWEGKVVASCVHCHQIGDAWRASYRERKEPVPSNLIYPFPPPQTIGLELAVDQIARVKSIIPGSAADRAGLRLGDDIVSLDRQPLLSTADVSWVLHQAADAGSLTAGVERNGQRHSLTIPLEAGWRYHSDISRRVGTWSMRAMALGGLQLDDLAADERERHALNPSQLALVARHVGEYGQHAAAKKAGFQKGDIIVEIAGSANRATEGELIGRLLREYRPGDQVPVTVLRGAEQLQLALPMQ